jgi:hypothetical protein
MSSEEHEVYIMQDEEEEEWVSPTPARAVILEAVTDQTDLDADDLDDLDTYVDCEDIREVLEGKGAEELTFTIESHDITVDSDGDVSVA